jgi:hypothetical protein
MYGKYSAEQLARKWQDKFDVKNIMSKYASSFLMKREKDIYDICFCKGEHEPTLSFNNGTYVGEDAIRKYFDAVDANTQIKSKLVQKLFPEFLAHRSDRDIHGVGESTVFPIVAGVVEIADDGKTAKGSWLCFGADISIGTDGPVHRWQYGTMAADFIKENGYWRIWHLIHVIDLDTPGGSNWAKEPKVYADLPEFEELRGLSLPTPTVPAELHESFSVGRPFTRMPLPPEPYVTFADTFSYGL